MSREIKFRGFDEETGRVELVYQIDFHEGFSYYIDDNSEVQRCVNDTLMQYTGLKDKDGKEIYEGDIVLVTYSDGSGYDNPVEVSFERGSFWCGMGYLNDVKIIEVIGNIHEHANLLEKTNGTK